MNDELLVGMYVEYGIFCDRLVSNPDKLRRFAIDYMRRAGDSVTEAELGQHMLNLRRRGQDNGGLPRLSRRYNGRNGSPSHRARPRSPKAPLAAQTSTP